MTDELAGVDPSAVDPAALDRLLDMTGGDPEFLDELVVTYLEDAGAQLAAMLVAAEAGSVEAMVRPAHSLKGNSESVGAGRLAEQCRQLELDGRSGTIDDAVERVRAAEAEFQRVQAELERLRAAR